MDLQIHLKEKDEINYMIDKKKMSDLPGINKYMITQNTVIGNLWLFSNFEYYLV